MNKIHLAVFLLSLNIPVHKIFDRLSNLSWILYYRNKIVES